MNLFRRLKADGRWSAIWVAWDADCDVWRSVNLNVEDKLSSMAASSMGVGPHVAEIDMKEVAK